MHELIRSSGAPRQDGDDANDDGGDEEPAGLPVDLQELGDVHLHLHDVAVEPVGAVEPADGDELDEGHQQDGVRRSVVHLAAAKLNDFFSPALTFLPGKPIEGLPSGAGS